MEIQPFTKDRWSLTPLVADQAPWFKGKEVATTLEYANPWKAIKDHVDEEDKKTFQELMQGANYSLGPSNSCRESNALRRRSRSSHKGRTIR